MRPLRAREILASHAKPLHVQAIRRNDGGHACLSAMSISSVLNPQHRMHRQSNLLADAPTSQAITRQPEPAPPTSYVDLYGLSKRPFGGQAERSAYILFNSHRRAFELLVNHMLNGSGAVLLTGDDGIGKTEMLRAAVDMAEGNGLHVIRLFRPPDGRLSRSELMTALTGDASATPDDIMRAVRIDHRKPVVIDDFDLLPSECLMVLRPLMDLREGGPALILSGASGIRRPEVVPLLNLLRNTIRLIPLSPAECRQFIERSLWIAGGTTRRLIESDAIRVIVAESGGTPGRVGRLMEAALTAGFGRGDNMITTRTVSSAIGSSSRRRHWRTRAADHVVGRTAAMISLGLFLAGAGLFAYEAWHGSASPPAAAPALPQPAVDPGKATAPQQPQQASPLSPDLIATLLKRGNDSLALGDIAAARLLLQKAADAKSASAALALGNKYDPNEAISQPGNADPGRAADWYRKAQALGDPTATGLLRRLGRSQ